MKQVTKEKIVNFIKKILKYECPAPSLLMSYEKKEIAELETEVDITGDPEEKPQVDSVIAKEIARFIVDKKLLSYHIEEKEFPGRGYNARIIVKIVEPLQPEWECDGKPLKYFP